MSYEEGYKIIWSSLNFLRGSFYRYDFLLYLIHAHILGLTKNYMGFIRSGARTIYHALYEENRNYPEYELKMYDQYGPELQRCDDRIFSKLNQALSKLICEDAFSA